MPARQGATDAQMAYALRHCLPQLTEPASFQDTHAAMTTQPAFLSADAFAAALEAIPPDDWCRTWAAGRTIMLRRTSKRLKEVVDKIRLPAVFRLSRSFWDDARNGTAAKKLKFVLRQLPLMSDWCRIFELALLALCHGRIQDIAAEVKVHQRWALR